MEKIRQYFLEKEAKKYFGEKKYNSIKTEFQSRYDNLCSEFFAKRSSHNIKDMSSRLGQLKNHIWVAGLMQVMGGMMTVVSLNRTDIYPLEETIVASIIGVLIAGLSTLVKVDLRNKFNEMKNLFIKKVNAGECESLSANTNNLDDDEVKYTKAVYTSAVNDIITK